MFDTIRKQAYSLIGQEDFQPKTWYEGNLNLINAVVVEWLIQIILAFRIGGAVLLALSINELWVSLDVLYILYRFRVFDFNGKHIPLGEVTLWKPLSFRCFVQYW